MNAKRPGGLQLNLSKMKSQQLERATDSEAEQMFSPKDNTARTHNSILIVTGRSNVTELGLDQLEDYEEDLYADTFRSQLSRNASTQSIRTEDYNTDDIDENHRMIFIDEKRLCHNFSDVIHDKTLSDKSIYTTQKNTSDSLEDNIDHNRNPEG